ITRYERDADFVDPGNLPVFIIIVCSGPKISQESSFHRQMEHVSVLLKSAASQTKTVLRFLVVTDSLAAYLNVLAIPSSWPLEYRRKVRLEHRDVWYPPDREAMKSLLRPCSSARLFLPEIITDLDSAVLIDTDTLFLRPPEALLMEIYNFNDKQAAGLAQTSMGLNHRNIPFPGPRGVNTGVMVMNLTRLRALPGGWTGTTLSAFDNYRNRLGITATNDIVNIALAQNPAILYDLDCVWNFGPGVCWRGTNHCPAAEEFGASLVHGTSASFVNTRNKKFRALYEGWRDHPVNGSLSDLYEAVTEKISMDTSRKIRCNKVKRLPFILTEGLRR
ncbi:Glucoside xylosyltransferase 1, partial [Halocaridina rubra]